MVVILKCHTLFYTLLIWEYKSRAYLLIETEKLTHIQLVVVTKQGSVINLEVSLLIYFNLKPSKSRYFLNIYPVFQWPSPLVSCELNYNRKLRLKLKIVRNMWLFTHIYLR